MPYMVTVIGNDKATWIQNLDETVWISHSANSLRKGMNPIILPLAMGKYLSRQGSLGIPTVLGEGKLWIQSYNISL